MASAESDTARALCALLAGYGPASRPPSGATASGILPTSAEFAAWVDACCVRLGLERPDVALEASGGEASEDPRWLGWWLLRMARASYAHQVAAWPAVDAQLVQRLDALLVDRPPREEAHGQLHVDTTSTLRRAQAIQARIAQHPGPVLAVGDDDAVTLALALLGVPNLHAIDVDERLLAFLERAGRQVGQPIRVSAVDVFEAPIPSVLRQQCAAVVTDPLRSLEDGLPFLLFGAAALRRTAPSWLFFADHPDWNFEHAALFDALSQAGLTSAEVIEHVHAYPLTAALFPKLADTARVVGGDLDWWVTLAEHVSAVTHLYVYRRAG